MIEKRDKSFDEYWEEVHSKTEWGNIQLSMSFGLLQGIIIIQRG